MPTTAAAAKAHRQNLKARARNSALKTQLKKLQVRLRKAVTAKQPDQAQTIAKELIRAYDKAAQKRVITGNTAARKKSRLLAGLRKV